MTGAPRIRRALLSVSDKSGVVDLARALAARGVTLLSTGGTARALAAAGLACEDVAATTGWPEMMDGRLKTLHPAIHGGLLARRDRPADMAAATAHRIGMIDLLVVNLYPFAATVAAGADPAACTEAIDIGGPAMLRAAAKNHAHVAVLTDPAQYTGLLAALDDKNRTDSHYRQRLAAAAFAHCAACDAAVAAWLQRGEAFPPVSFMVGYRQRMLRYGENPHQRAALYKTGPDGLGDAHQLQGKPPGYNNLLDANAARALVSAFDRPAVVIVKHGTPCGAALGETLVAAHAAALACDPVSAFGGIVAVNRPLDAEAARAVIAVFTEVVIAPDFTTGARAVLAAKPNLRALQLSLPHPVHGQPAAMEIRPVDGGFLLQDADDPAPVAEAGPEGRPPPAWQVVSTRHPTAEECTDLCFAETVCQHVRSNAIVLARAQATVGIGAGQTSRVDSAGIAARKSTPDGTARPMVAASDAFFPFPDGLEILIQAGVTAVIQPGGAKRDAAVTATANAAGIAMIHTTRRHFRH